MTHYSSGGKIVESERYIWNTKDRLGTGATGAVYSGYHKVNGKKVAIKEFKQQNYYTTQQKEIEVLRNLPPQRNIVTLFDSDVEKPHHLPILVMELCTAGSLYDVIEKPENAHGMSEHEFTTVMIDISEGLAHLRKNNVIHRDIKPGNILRCINPDGTYTYKLTDFGAARELADTDRFGSLYGTEEYLHPDIYEKALVHAWKEITFPAKVDLWSIGATLFHSATGRLPFHHYSQRRDKGLMFHILSKKEKGAISGWQEIPNGDIHWSKTLPQDTKISRGLKMLLEPILQGVMQVNFDDMMEFSDYFEGIRNIANMRVFDVYVVSQCELLKVHMNKQEPKPYSTLRKLISDQSGVDYSFIELFYENLPLKAKDSIPLDKYPDTTEDKPIFAYGGHVEEHLKPIPIGQVPGLPNAKDVKGAIQFSRDCSKLIHYHKHIVEGVNRKYVMMQQAAFCMSHVMKKDAEVLEKLLGTIRTSFSALHLQIFNQIGSLWSLREVLNGMNECVNGALDGIIEGLIRDKRDKQGEAEFMSKSFEAIQLKAHGILEAVKECEEWKNTCQPLENFGKRVAMATHQCIEVDEEVVLVKSLVRNLTHQHNPNQSYESKVLMFTKNSLHKRLTDSSERTIFLQGRLTAIHKELHKWLNDVVSARGDVQMISRAIEKEIEKYAQQNGELQKWIQESDTNLKEIAKRIVQVFDNYVAKVSRPHVPVSQSKSAYQASRPPQLSQSHKDELVKLIHQSREIITSLKSSKDTLRHETMRIQECTQSILSSVD